MTFRSVAVAIDGSETAGNALAEAIEIAKSFGSELSVVAVAPFAPVYVAPNEPFVAPPITESPLPKYQALVDAAVKTAKDAGLPRVSGTCLEGVVVDELLAWIGSRPIDLLVVGSRGLSAAQRFLLGSVSTGLVTRAPCPVLVVRPKPTPRGP
jgi:nucleotide-binding universal stress UspA family protein